MAQAALLTEFTKDNCFDGEELMRYLYNAYNMFKKKYGCTYCSYTLECLSTSKKIQISTNRAWADFFYFKNLVQNCPVVDALRSLNKDTLSDNTLIWDYIRPQTRQAKIINGLRDDFSISHGLSFSTFLLNKSFGPYLEIITLTGNKLDVSFFKEILQDKDYVCSAIHPLRIKGYNLLNKINYDLPKIGDINRQELK